MLRSLFKFVRDPGRYFPVARARLLQALKRGEHQLSPFFSRTAYFLQGQMDINPLGRWHRPEFVAECGGYFLPNDPATRTIVDFDAWDLVRRDMLILLLRTILARNIPGDLAEIGVYRGQTAKLFHHYLPERPLHLFDTFSGFAEQDVARENKVTGHQVHITEFTDTSVETVMQYVAPLRPENIVLHVGFFPATAPTDWTEKRFAFVHIDADLYEPILASLRYFYDKVSPGGMIVVHDYNAWPGSRRAVDEFFGDKPECPIPMPDKSGSVLIVKQ